MDQPPINETQPEVESVQQVLAAVGEKLGPDAPELRSITIRRGGKGEYAFRLYPTNNEDHIGGIVRL